MDILLTAIAELSNPFRLLMLVAGVIAGLIVGVIPGIGGIFGLALLIPLTYHLDAFAAFALLLGMASVVNTSDTIPAILLGVPGTVGAVATVVDGHSMAKNGEAARAFGAAYTASMIGGVFGALLLAIAIPLMRPLVLYLKTPDFLAIGGFGLSVVALLAGSQPLKGLAAAMLGLLLAYVGVDSNAGSHRWTFGQVYLWEGLPIVVVFLGLFGLPELATLLARGSIQGKIGIIPSYAQMFRGARDAIRELPLIIRCSWIGAVLGAVPGIGVAAIDWIAYGHAARQGQKGDSPAFGQGNVRGVIAPESANNAKEGGSLIPTIAFGVPGSASMAILLGAFMVQGLVPGPDMLGKNAPITVSMVLTIALANIIGAGICLFLTKPLARLTSIPAAVMVPLIVAFLVIGCFQNNMSVFDFLLLGGAGFVGMAMKELNWPRSAFSLGFVLGPTLEQNFFLVYQIHGWNWLTHPVALVLTIIALVGFVRHALNWHRERNKPRALPAALPDFLFAALLFVLAVAAVVTASAFPVAAGIFPMISSSVLAVLALLVGMQALRRWRREGLQPALPSQLKPEGEWSPTGEFAFGAGAQLLAMCAVMALLILLAGHLAAAAVFAAGGLLILRATTWPKAALCALGVTAFVYAIFDLLVHRPLAEAVALATRRFMTWRQRAPQADPAPARAAGACRFR